MAKLKTFDPLAAIAASVRDRWSANEWAVLTAGRSGVTGRYRRGESESTLALKGHARLVESGWTLLDVDETAAAGELHGARVRGDL